MLELLLVLLVLVNTCVLGVMYIRIYRIQRGVHDIRERASGATPDETRLAADALWRQFEALISMYRILEDRPIFPPTRGWAASPDFLYLLFRYVMEAKPRLILELGGGATTIVLGLLCEKLGRGKVVSVENHPVFAERLRNETSSRGLDDIVEIIHAPLKEIRLDGFEELFLWYDLAGAELSGVEMLVIDGPFGRVNRLARYPAGPLLFPMLSPGAAVFVDDADREDEMEMVRLWRGLYPDLGIRHHSTEKGACELFFLDEKIKAWSGRGASNSGSAKPSHIERDADA
jgi:hypothetical protein